MQKFIHLRLHSEFSVVDGILRIKDIVKLSQRNKMFAVALTDLHNMFGMVKFYQACRREGVKPIIGAELQLEDDSANQYKILALVKNNDGLRELNELITKSYLLNKINDIAVIRESWLLSGNYTNLIILSGGVSGDIAPMITRSNLQEARAKLLRWSQAFPDSYYVELHRIGHPDADLVVEHSVKLANELGLPLVATHPIQFATENDYIAHEVRVCVADGDQLDNDSRVSKFGEDQYFLTGEQMCERFSDIPGALQNTLEIAKRCNLTITLGKYFLPNFTPEGNLSIDNYLLNLAKAGLEQRLLEIFPDKIIRAEEQGTYLSRLEMEVQMINQMGFAGYFLIVADFINYAKQNGIPVGPGRGSGAGSLVAFSLGITDVEPLRYGLIFERFLNPDRVSMPDFDIDFCQEKRELVIEYVKQKYGEDAVSQIATFGTMSSKAVIKDVGRALSLSYGLCDSLSKLILNTPAKSYSLLDAYDKFPELKERIDDGDDEIKRLWDLSLQLEDLTRSIGKHAAGVLIAPSKLTDFCPLYLADGMQTSQLDKDDVERIGLVKFDFLGLRNLTIIQETLDNIKQLYNVDVKLSSYDFDDPGVYDLLKQGNTSAIFQLESPGMRRVLVKLEPDRFEDIIALLALYRPGPLGSGMVDDFVKRKKGEEQPDYFHEDLKACLETTYGVIVYQEQVMQISQIIGGYTLGSADLLRRAMGKKKPEEMAMHKTTFMDGAVKKGYTAKLAEELFDLMAKFAEYGFNKSHSAAYAVISYHTAYLKAHYLSCFMAATLSSELDKTDKLYELYQDCLENNLTVLPPDINTSEYRFKPIDKSTISYALGAIKGVGHGAADLILAERHKNGRFSSFSDFCLRVDKKVINKKTLESLVKAGAFDQFTANRAKLYNNIPMVLNEILRRNNNTNQASLFDGMDMADSLEEDQIPLDEFPEWEQKQMLAMEKQALGYYFSGSLFDEYKEVVKRLGITPLNQYTLDNEKVAEMLSGQLSGHRSREKPQVLVCGVINYLGSRPMKKGGKMTFVKIEDDASEIECVVFSNELDKYKPLIKIDEFVFIFGELVYDSFREQIKVTAKKIHTIDEILGDSVERVELHVNHEFDVDQLGSLVDMNGSAAVVLHYNNTEAKCKVELGKEYKFITNYKNINNLNTLVGKQRWSITCVEE